MPNLRVLENALPFAPLKVCALDSAAKLGKSVDNYLVDFRKSLKTPPTLAFLMSFLKKKKSSQGPTNKRRHM